MRIMRPQSIDLTSEHLPEYPYEDARPRPEPENDPVHAIVWGLLVSVTFGAGLLCGLMTRQILVFFAALLHHA